MIAENRAQAVDHVVVEERSGDFGESGSPVMMMSEVFADPELTRLAVVVVYLGASRFLDLEALSLRFGTARTPRLSRRHVVNWARRSRFMHFAKTASHWVRVGVNIIRAMPTMLWELHDC